MAKLKRSLGTRTFAAMALLATSGALAAPAGAATAKECSQVSAATLRAEGQRFMTSMLGSTNARAGMDRVMTSMMGRRARDQAYEAMGAAARGCPATMPAGAMRMMGAMGGMMAMMGGGPGASMMGAGGSGSTMGSGGVTGMGSSTSGATDPATMMDDAGRGSGVASHDDWGGFETVMVLLMALLAAGIVAGTVLLVRRTRQPAPR